TRLLMDIDSTELTTMLMHADSQQGCDVHCTREQFEKKDINRIYLKLSNKKSSTALSYQGFLRFHLLSNDGNWLVIACASSITFVDTHKPETRMKWDPFLGIKSVCAAHNSPLFAVQ